MESLVLGCSLITVIARAEQTRDRPLADALGDPFAALWTVLGAIAVAVATGIAATLAGV